MSTEQKRTNDCLRLLDNSFRKDFNSIRLNTHNTISHELAKTIVSYLLIQQGKQILTEAIFKDNKGRADILIPNEFKVIEILESETEKEALEKTTKYPDDLDVHILFSKDVLKCVEDDMYDRILL